MTRKENNNAIFLITKKGKTPLPSQENTKTIVKISKSLTSDDFDLKNLQSSFNNQNKLLKSTSISNHKFQSSFKPPDKTLDVDLLDNNIQNILKDYGNEAITNKKEGENENSPFVNEKNIFISKRFSLSSIKYANIALLNNNNNKIIQNDINDNNNIEKGDCLNEENIDSNYISNEFMNYNHKFSNINANLLRVNDNKEIIKKKFNYEIQLPKYKYDSIGIIDKDQNDSDDIYLMIEESNKINAQKDNEDEIEGKIDEMSNEGNDCNEDELDYLKEEEENRRNNVNQSRRVISNLSNNNIHSNSYYNIEFNQNKTPFINFNLNDKLFQENFITNYIIADLTKWGKPFHWDEEVNKANFLIFGFNTFFPIQREIINANLSNKEIFVCMPTGGGKSLSFQLPAIIQYGVTLVIMPLLSLIQDQISFLTELGVKVLFLNTKGTNEAWDNYIHIFHSTNEEYQCKFLFITPEKIIQSTKTLSLIERLYNDNILLRCVIDECHCVSQWGREFRPDYLNLKIIKQKFPNLPILAMTATATNKIIEDVINQLGMKDTLYFRASYNRKNLYIEVRNKNYYNNVIGNIGDFILKYYPNSSGLIYCLSKKMCEDIYRELNLKYHISCAFYHSALSDRERSQVQHKWKNDDIKVIIATVAFGMGINKKDVRFVIHYSMPKSFEGYYQEIGRAGRDGKISHCILYYSHSDRKINECLLMRCMLNKKLQSESLRKMTQMIDYCEEVCECRRVIALAYFDELFNRDNCGLMCDNCKKGLNYENVDVTNEAIIILNFLYYCYITKTEITMHIMIEYLKGIKAKNKNRFKFPSNEGNFRKLNSKNINEITKITRKLIIMHFIDEYIVSYNKIVYTKIEISNEGIEYLKRGTFGNDIVISFIKRERNEYSNKENNSNKEKENIKWKVKKAVKTVEENNISTHTIGSIIPKTRPRYIRNVDISTVNKKYIEYEEEDCGLCTLEQFNDLFSQLKVKRLDILNEENNRIFKETIDGNFKKLTLDDIFTDNGLKELCRKLPTDESDLNPNSIYDVGKSELLKYGKFFLYIIQKHIKIYGINKEKAREEAIRKKLRQKEKKDESKRNLKTIKEENLPNNKEEDDLICFEEKKNKIEETKIKEENEREIVKERNTKKRKRSEVSSSEDEDINHSIKEHRILNEVNKRKKSKKRKFY